ncbi:hypothetical protein M569_16904 [Genlisea aurea]|uniref:Uncharacterized protein n=1 Tax=Genlisea aurea TaxID=192259 RepID=S8D5M1_9LAMI|nr:hypothetical protein M569_16904 [Genlisea aurea]
MASISLHGVVLHDNKLFSSYNNSHIPLHNCNLFNSGNKINLSFKHAHKQQRILSCRVSSFDVTQSHDVQETDDDKSVVETRQRVRKIDEGEAIEYIKELLRTTGDGRISVSPYDTAWKINCPTARGAINISFVHTIASSIR